MISSTIRDIFSNLSIGFIFCFLLLMVSGKIPHLWTILKAETVKQKIIFSPYWATVTFMLFYCLGVVITDFGNNVLSPFQPKCDLYNKVAFIPRLLVRRPDRVTHYSVITERGDFLKLTSLGKDLFRQINFIRLRYEQLNYPVDFFVFWDAVQKGYKPGSKTDSINYLLCEEIYYTAKNYCYSQNTLYDELSFIQRKIDFFVGLTMLSILSLLLFCICVTGLIYKKIRRGEKVFTRHNVNALFLFIFGIMFLLFVDGLYLSYSDFNRRVYGYFITMLDLR